MKQKSKITISDLKKLDRHIIDNFDPKKTREKELEVNKDIYWVEGYLCALTSSPELMIKMDYWLPYINGEDCEFESENHINDIMSSIFAIKNNIVKKLNDNSYKPLYEQYNLKNEPKADLITRWSKGYMFATILFSSRFLEEGVNKIEEEIATVLLPIVVGTGDYPKEKLEKDGVSKEEIIEKIPLAVQMFDVISSNIRKELISNMMKENLKIVANDNKVGRNDPCFCGSGKKFKKCCLSKLSDTIH